MLTVNIEHLARSNFILAAVRRATPKSLPYYVKWGLIRAFNGAVLCSDETTLQVLFYDPTHDVNEEGNYNVRLPSMIVSGHVSTDSKRRIEADQFTAVVTEADSEFDSMLAGFESVRHEIRTLSLIIQHQVATTSGVEDAVDSIAIPLHDACGQDIIVASVHPVPFAADQLHETELFIEFDSPVHEAQLVYKLKKLIPNIQSPIFGRGFTLMDASESELPGVTWAHIIARHF